MAESPPPTVPPAANPANKWSAFVLPPIARFAITGAANSVIGFAVILLALRLGFSDVAANFTGFVVGLAVGFVVNRTWTFAVKRDVGLAEVVRYLAGFGVAWGLNIAVVLIGVEAGMAGSPLIHLAGCVLYSLAFYGISRYFVFI